MSWLADISFAVQVSELTIGFSGYPISCPFCVQPTKFVAQGVDVLARGDFIFVSFFQVADVSFAFSKDEFSGAFSRSAGRVSTRCDLVCGKDILFVRAKTCHCVNLDVVIEAYNCSRCMRW